jgi:predicted CoA-substrate-specific enzyme activase
MTSTSQAGTSGPCFLGIDIGSLTVKSVLLDSQEHLLGRGVASAGYGGQEAAAELVAQVLREAHAGDSVAYAVVTGYGRVLFRTADEEMSEISCHARGAFHLCPKVRTVIDIGGQDSKAIRLDANGRVVDFAMNDKCAAGTGRFLEVMAAALGLPVAEFGRLALQSQHPVSISSTCTVFAESEAISHMARGAERQDVAAGLHRAIASRILGLAAHVGVVAKVLLTGGVALNTGLVAALTELCNCHPTGAGHEALALAGTFSLTVPPDPQVVGALGAALFALQRGRR